MQPPRPPLEGRVDYLQPQTFGSIIGNSFKILFKNWLQLVSIYGPLTVPVGLVRIFLQYNGAENVAAIFRILEFLMGMLGAFPLCVVISDICIGLKPNVARSYRRAFQHFGRVIVVYLALV